MQRISTHLLSATCLMSFHPLLFMLKSALMQRMSTHPLSAACLMLFHPLPFMLKSALMQRISTHPLTAACLMSFHPLPFMSGKPWNVFFRPFLFSNNSSLSPIMLM